MRAIRLILAVIALPVLSWGFVGCDSRAPAPASLGSTHPFDAAYASLDPELVRLAEARLARDLNTLKDADFHRMLRRSDAAIRQIRACFLDTGFAPIFRGSSLVGEASPNDQRVSIACWILSFEARVVRDSDPQRSLDNCSAVLDCIQRLAAERRTVTILIAADILSCNGGTLDSAARTPGASVSDIAAFRRRVESLNHKQPLGILSALRAEPDFLLASILDRSIRDAKDKRDKDQYHNPQTGLPPDDAELKAFCAGFLAKKRPDMERFYSDLCERWEDEPDFLAVVRDGENGEYGTLIPAEARAMKSVRASMMQTRRRIMTLREAAGIEPAGSK